MGGATDHGAGPGSHGPSKRLSQRLAERAAAHGSGTLRVDEFMAAALYDPAEGYYTQARTIGGVRRDFATIPSLSPLLGRAIARWAASLPGTGRGAWDLVEVGAGAGHLAAAVIDAVGWWARRRLRYRIVEVSAGLRRAQQELLTGRRVVWHDTVAEAVAASERPVVVSNELVDAFPCRLLRFEDGSWHELRLPWPPAAEPMLQSHPLTNLDLSGFSAADPGRWPAAVIPPGQVVEVQPAYRAWLADWLPTAGRIDHLTIDYGDAMPALYRDRPTGTLRGYVAHQRLTGAAVFRAPGKVDLTCDVNFTDLEVWGAAAGLQTVALIDQAGFLTHWLPEGKGAGRERELAAVTDPDGAGGAFKVLWQART